MKRNKGITLIALVVTIIVLLILAGISIAMLTGTNGIITRTNEARNENVKGTEREQIKLAYGAEKSYILEKGSTEVVTAGDLESRLRTDGAKIVSVEEEDGKLKVTFDTGNVYYVDGDGDITDGTPIEPVTPPTIGEVEEPQTTTPTELGGPCGVVEIAWLDMNNNVISNPLSPNLGNMEKIAWDNSSNEFTPNSNSDWYDYNSNKWANAKNPEDGSYFVWIPRYAYKIIYFDNETNKNAYIADNTSKTGITGYSTIYGIINANGQVVEGTQTNISDTVKTAGYRDYIPHPGFLGTGYEDLGGGFGENSKGITGIWIAKYEMAKEISADEGTTWTNTTISSWLTGSVATTKAGSNRFIRVVSKPGTSSWIWINISNCYENAYHYDRDKESHLIKNSEWGAVAYLTHSKYGRNGTEITINRNEYTGGGVGTAYTTNTNQTSTGNTYGIYDLSGGLSEFVAAFNKEHTGSLFEKYSEKGKMFASYSGTSTKYATAYSNSTKTKEGDFTVGDVSRTGEAIREVWVRNMFGWFSDYSYFVNVGGPFFIRGGNFSDGTNAGVFASRESYGSDSTAAGFRVVLAK